SRPGPRPPPEAPVPTVVTDPGPTPGATVDPISAIPLLVSAPLAAPIVRPKVWRVVAAIAAINSQSFAQPFLARLAPDRQVFVGQEHWLIRSFHRKEPQG